MAVTAVMATMAVMAGIRIMAFMAVMASWQLWQIPELWQLWRLIRLRRQFAEFLRQSFTQRSGIWVPVLVLFSATISGLPPEQQLVDFLFVTALFGRPTTTTFTSY